MCNGKHPQMIVWGGGYNYFLGEEFVAFYKTRAWNEPEEVFLILNARGDGYAGYPGTRDGGRMTWQPISTAPKDEINPFLVLLPGKDVCKTLAVQVSNFEGRMYPDCRDGIIDWERCDNHSNPLAAPFPAACNRWRGLMEAQILIQLIIITAAAAHTRTRER